MVKNWSLTFDVWYPWLPYIFDNIITLNNQPGLRSILSVTEVDFQNIICDYQQSQIIINQKNNNII